MSETQSMQEALVHALLSDDSNRDVCFDQKGLEAYRRGLFANARRALEVTFQRYYNSLVLAVLKPVPPLTYRHPHLQLVTGACGETTSQSISPNNRHWQSCPI